MAPLGILVKKYKIPQVCKQGQTLPASLVRVIGSFPVSIIQFPKSNKDRAC